MTGAGAGDWTSLLAQIGASPAAWRFTGAALTTLPDWQIELAGTGIDVSLEDIAIDQSTGLYLFRGQQVLIYIRFTNRSREILEHDKDQAPRFHVRDCRTIETMKNANRYQRYVAIARTDGFFPVVSRELDGSAHELDAPLGPCKNCLSEMNFRRYRDQPAQRGRIWGTFSIEEFFATCSSSISTIPLDSCSAVDPRTYAENWPQRSEEVRQRAHWRCSQCQVELRAHRRLLHVHHVDRDKANNWHFNLRPLCVLCHRDQPGHSKMYVSYENELLVRRMRREQGLQLS